MKKLPSFFVVGAQKAGTTTLHDWLAMQPGVSLPTIKETHFFSEAEKFAKGLQWYSQWYKQISTDSIVGEIDPEYMFFPEALDRIHRTIKGTLKFLFLLRNPLDRAYSQYQMSKRRGHEDLSFPEALARENERIHAVDNRFALDHHSYLARGRYCEQILRFKEIFPDSPLMFIKFDDLFLSDKKLKIYAEICDFVGIPANSVVLSEPDKRSNTSSIPRSRLIRNLVYRKYPVKSMIGKLIPSEKLKLYLAQKLDSLNQKPARRTRNECKAKVPATFKHECNHEVSELERLTGLNLADWLN
ncbi:MAG: sulfotransferase domain-containing protein [Desulfobulbaceae bacterium]|nr:sulfotransferase domain-containing protein [Desulfobulbaceae bacterium]